MMYRYGDKGLQLMHAPRTLLSTAVFPVSSSIEIQEMKSEGKPRACRIETRDSQQTESNAFLKSSLIMDVGAFLL